MGKYTTGSRLKMYTFLPRFAAQLDSKGPFPWCPFVSAPYPTYGASDLCSPYDQHVLFCVDAAQMLRGLS